MRILLIILLTKLLALSLSPTGKTLITTGGLSFLSHISTAQTKQPNSGLFSLTRDFRIYEAIIPSSLAPDPYVLPIFLKADTFGHITLPRVTARPSLSSTTRVSVFDGSGNMAWIAPDSLLKDYVTNSDLGTYMTFSDTVPLGPIMTLYDKEVAMNQIGDEMDLKQNSSDTTIYDATRYWVWQQGYLTGITSGQVTTALGYTPYNASNPSNYISNLGSFTTTDLSEGTNLYYTAARFNTAFGTKTTTDLAEGTNLYWTTSRFNTSFGAKTTTDLAEGTNLYYTAARFNTAFSGKSTTDLSEGTNLYFTNARSRNAVSAGSGMGYNSSTGQFTNAAPDQTVVLNNGTNINVTGTYPTFTINATGNTLPSLGSANQLLRVNAGASAAEWFTPSFLTGNQTITLSGDVTGSGATSISTTLANSGVSAGTYRAAVTVDAKGRVTSAINPTINNAVSRSLSNAAGSTNRYTISASQPAFVTYSITMNFTVTALLSSSATVFLEYSTDAGSNWLLVSQVTTSFGLGLALSGSNDMSLSGYIPANALVRLRPATTNSSVSYTTGQELLY